jgi:hypothetical protein
MKMSDNKKCILTLCENKISGEYFCEHHSNNLSYAMKKSLIKNEKAWEVYREVENTPKTQSEIMIDDLESCGFTKMSQEEQIDLLKNCLLKILKGELE